MNNTIPEHTAHLVERLLQRYCARVCPPTARHTVRLAFELQSDRVTLFELRMVCGVPGALRRVPLAELRYRARDHHWLLFERENADPARQQGWRRYSGVRSGSVRSEGHANRSRNFIDLLREIDTNPTGAFWPRIDGASLRWCQSSGRCTACEWRYREILGLENQQRATERPQLAAGVSAVSD
ncbi:MAG: hypothetical protein IPG25_03200 [Proteobacteria bacterium]|nr:hypothetical protein [Pseudomonadota bacterium]